MAGGSIRSRSLIGALLAGMAFAMVPAPHARAQDAEPPGTLRVKIELRAASNDAIDACRHEFLSEGEAERLGRAVARALRTGPADIIFDPDIAEHCALVDPDRPVQERDTTRPHGRRFTIDTTALLRVARDAGFERLRLELCTPIARREFDGADPNETTLCEWRGWGWVADQPIRVSVAFWATPADARRATAASLGGLALMLLVLGFVALRAGRGRVAWWLTRHRWAGILVIVLAIGAFVIGWVAVVYESWFIHSLQLVYGLDDVGEGLIVFAPMGLGVLAIVGTGMLAATRSRRINAPPPTDGLEPTEHPAGQRFQPIAVTVALVLGLPMMLLELQSVSNALIYAFLALAVAVAVLAPRIMGFIAASSYRLTRTPEGDALLLSLRAIGLQVRRVFVSDNPLRDQEPNVIAPVSVLRSGSTVMVWRELFTLPPNELTGAVILASGPQRSAWFATLVPVAISLVRDLTSATVSVHPIAYVVAAAAGIGRELARIAEKRGVLARIRTSLTPTDALRGLLRTWRRETELLYRWLDAGQVTPPKTRIRRRPIPAPAPDELREEAVEAARDHALAVGLDPMAVDGLALEVWPPGVGTTASTLGP